MANPEDIFTPTAIATKEMFERRNEPDQAGNPGLQDRLVQAIKRPGTQVRVHGDTGVGKSSLVSFAASECDRNALVVECRSAMDFADMTEQAIRGLRNVKLVKFTKKSTTTGRAEGSLTVKLVATIKGHFEYGRSKEREFEIVESSPLELLIDLMKQEKYRLLVLDNFQNVDSEATRLEVAQMMEILADRSARTNDLKIIVVGIAQDADTLLTPSPSVRRRTVDVGVPRMPDDEIEAILTNGFSRLKLSIEQSLLDYLVYFSDGFPFFAHTIGLNVSLAAREAGSRSILASHVAAGLLRTVNEVDETYRTRVSKAHEAGGSVQPRKRILELLAKSSERSWSAAEVKRLWVEEHGTPKNGLQFIDSAMGGLIKEINGRVLARDESTSPYRYRFEDPHFRAYLRIRADLTSEDDTTGLAQSYDPPPFYPGSLS